MCPHNPVTELLNKIKHATKNTNLTIPDVLNVTQHLFYRTHGRGGPLKTRSREKLKPLVSKYRMNSQDTFPPFFIANTLEAQPRKIHIWEFSKDFYVQLESEITKELVNRAIKNVGGLKRLARVLKKGVTMVQYYRGTVRYYRGRRPFIPLATLLTLCDLAGNEFAIEKVEPHIIAYKGGLTAKVIRNPHIPLVETPALFAFMGHLAGDGGHSSDCGTYSNTQEPLIRKFFTLLRVVFGEVLVRTKVEKGKKDCLTVGFGTTIIRLLRHLYGVDFRTFTTRVPQRLFELPREYAAAFLKAFADDEGTVHDSYIRLDSANRELLQDVYDLVQVKFPELGEFAVFGIKDRKSYPKGADIYNIRFRVGAFESYRALIGFDHPEKQQELDRILARRERGWKQRPPGTTRRMLLDILSSTPMNVKDLARKLDVRVNTVRPHLKGLIGLGVVRVRDKKEGARGGVKVFDITERGRKFLKFPSIGLLASGRAGRSKVKLLKVLTGGSLIMKDLERKLDLNMATIRQRLNGVRIRGRWYPGLFELGLVKRSGEGGSADPYVYSLTDEGRRFFVDLEALFPDLCNSL